MGGGSLDSRCESDRTRIPNRRVLIVITSIVGGGAEAEAIALAQTLHARQWEVGGISLLDPRGAEEGLTDRGIVLECVGMGRSGADTIPQMRLASGIRL